MILNTDGAKVSTSHYACTRATFNMSQNNPRHLLAGAKFTQSLHKKYLTCVKSIPTTPIAESVCYDLTWVMCLHSD